MRINIEDVLEAEKKRRGINSLNLEDIVWVKDGQAFHVDEVVVAKFESIGLSNVDFITSGYYLEGYLEANK